MGDSVTEGTVEQWLKGSLSFFPFFFLFLFSHSHSIFFLSLTFPSPLPGAGDFVEMDEIVGTIETDKTAQEIRAPESGLLINPPFCVVHVFNSLFLLLTPFPPQKNQQQKTKQNKTKQNKTKQKTKKKQEPSKNATSPKETQSKSAPNFSE